MRESYIKSRVNQTYYINMVEQFDNTIGGYKGWFLPSRPWIFWCSISRIYPPSYKLIGLNHFLEIRSRCHARIFTILINFQVRLALFSMYLNFLEVEEYISDSTSPLNYFTISLNIIFQNYITLKMASINVHKYLGNKKKDSDSSSFELQSDSESGISHENSECVKREKKQKLKKKKRRIYSTKSKGNWDLEEDVRFMNFMIENRQSFENRNLRRSNKIFKLMARHVRTRCPQQCRSHHQKYEKKYSTFDQIIGFIENKANRGQQLSIKSEQNKDNIQERQSGKMYRKIKQKPTQQSEGIKGKNEVPTVEPLPSSQFQLHKEEQGYNILLAFQPNLSVKVIIDLCSLNVY